MGLLAEVMLVSMPAYACLHIATRAGIIPDFGHYLWYTTEIGVVCSCIHRSNVDSVIFDLSMRLSLSVFVLSTFVMCLRRQFRRTCELEDTVVMIRCDSIVGQRISLYLVFNSLLGRLESSRKYAKGRCGYE